MDSKILHNIKDTPFSERETFNNAILLLSMVKSEYYYIVGFSRLDNKIEIGFDFEDKLYGRISESIEVDFSGDPKGIRILAKLANVFLERKTKLPFELDKFSIISGNVFYENLFEKDDVIPTSMDKLNYIILEVKQEIGNFITNVYETILREGEKNEVGVF